FRLSQAHGRCLRAALCDLSPRAWYRSGGSWNRGDMYLGDPTRTCVSGSAPDDEYYVCQTDGRLRPFASERALGKSIPRLALSFVQAQGQIQSPDSRRYSYTQRGPALLKESDGDTERGR